MTNVNSDDLVERYLSVWNEPDAAARQVLIAETWTPQGQYLDPALSAEGWTAISAMVEAVQQRFPDHRFQRVGPIDAHHDRLRFAWELADPGGACALSGVDFAQVAADGRLASVTGFFDSHA